MQSVPQHNVAVREFAKMEPLRRQQLESNRAQGFAADEDLIFKVSPNEAVLVEGAHVYVQLVDFDNAMMEQGRETEASHQRALNMLHLHYGICDRVAANFEAQRVDYHGGRMHAVIVSPSGSQSARQRAQRAVAFANAITAATEEAGRIAANASYKTGVRVGIDSGPSVAVNSGRAGEPEPLFLGNPANYAAKLADGDQAGIYVSDNIRRELGQSLCRGGLAAERLSMFSLGGQNPFDLSQATISRAIAEVAPTVFNFHRHSPPLKSIDFKLLSPSNSIRMGLISLFADIDGFTKYVADCIAGNSVAEMVANLHVFRSEMAATLKEDFDGRKVRFVGDCLHGLVAEGTTIETHESNTVSRAVEAAGGLRSSFELCRELLPSVQQLGLAIGIELGATPITRIGIRGDRSVRCSVSKAVSTSETLQKHGNGFQTRLGVHALTVAPAAVKRLFDDSGSAENLDYNSVAAHLTPAPVVIRIGNAASVSRPHCAK
jgi:class 3 adenylate cyclase